jgi:hypothetical protein
MISNRKRMHQIVIDEHNYEALKRLGRVPETFNTVVTRVLEENRKFRRD